ncbi:MAG TPA: mechanosensitive ion channel, partial [Planctomycetes bacterium]|nr:mechanosensitive ion channel [Planctomycetota bacterium]
NFDRTISTIPTINLVNKPFKNWRNMSQGQGRRIKRSIKLDAASVRFLNKEEIERYGKLDMLQDYIKAKMTLLDESNKATKASTPPLEVRRLTNKWLKQHPQINQGMTLLVRQLQPTATGLPLEIYAFTRTTAWGEYEDIMADLFDFLLAAVHEFNLRLYQDPTGQDVRATATEGPRDVG